MATLIQEQRSLSDDVTTNGGNDPLYDPSLPWHPGEQEMHRLLRIPRRTDNPTSAGLPARYAYRITASPLVALGTLLDSSSSPRGAGGGGGRQRRPWVTLVGGQAGFARPVAEGVLAMRFVGDVGSGGDEVLRSLLTAWEEEEGGAGGENGGNGEPGKAGVEAEERKIVLDKIVRPPGGGKIMAGLAIDLETRDRVKFAGRMIGGSMTGYKHPDDAGGDADKVAAAAGEVQIAFSITESLGNCPKYLNKKHITPHIPSPRLVYQGDQDDDDDGKDSGGSGGIQLPREALDLVSKADMFFLSSKHGVGDSMDVNHRGGAPGFLRVLSSPRQAGSGGNKATTSLIYPEFSGNNLYQTLGNLRRDPLLGICVPDYDTGDVLYATGTAEVLIGDRAAAYLPRAKLAVKLDIEAIQFVKDGLGFRGRPLDYSPYNPPVKYLATEKQDASATMEGNKGGIAVATLKTRKQITDTVARYTFALSRTEEQKRQQTNQARLEPWEAGQYITMDFSEELDNGWQHMADDDPQSLNDDYVRSFTISAPPKTTTAEPDEFEITVRRHGPVTALLSRWNLAVPLEVPVLGFGGDKEFRLLLAKDDGGGEGQVAAAKDHVFLAQGVGITPLMAQAPGVIASIADTGLEGSFRLLWSLRVDDMMLAQDVLGRVSGLAELTTLFVTSKAGSGQQGAAAESALKEVEDMGAKVVQRRMGRDDVLGTGEKGRRKYYGCMSGGMRKALLEWMADEELVVESFDY